jgi:hypothetical protein
MSIIGVNHILSVVNLTASSNTNVIQDAAWGTGSIGANGGVIDKLTINGNASNQTSTIATSALVTASTSIPVTGVSSVSVPAVPEANQPAITTAAFPNNLMWIGKNLCTVTGYTGGSFTGVSCATAFTAAPEMLINPFGGIGHGIAIQSPQVIIGEDVLITNTVGSGVIYEGASPSSIIYECSIGKVRAQIIGRYGIEILPWASDSQVNNLNIQGGLGCLFVGANDWFFGNVHLEGQNGSAVIGGALVPGYLAPQALRVCCTGLQIANVTFDSIPYDCLRIDCISYNDVVRDVMVRGWGQFLSNAGYGAGSGITMYGNQTTLTAGRLALNLDLPGFIYEGIVAKPVGFIIGAPSSTASSIQVNNALGFSSLGSSVGGTVAWTSGTGGSFNYTGVTSAGSAVANSANIGDATLTLTSTTGLASSGTLNVNVTGALRVTYTSISGNVLNGVSGITAALPAGTGVSQHFLTGVTQATGSSQTISDSSQISQLGRKVVPVSGTTTIGKVTLYTNPALVPTTDQSDTLVRLDGEANGHPNPFYGSITIAAGSATGSVNHNLGIVIPAGFYGGTPTSDPQQLWKITVSSTQITITLDSVAVTNAVTFNVWALASRV